jgi:hypothetical protein
MRKVVFVIFVSFLLATLAFVHKGNVPAVKANLPIYQGDLVLNGNNVTTIEGRFDINGSIIVEENATLFMKNVVVNFTEVEDDQFNVTLWKPANGNPRFIVDNATIIANGHKVTLYLFNNSTASIYKLIESEDVKLHFLDNSTALISNSTLEQIWASRYSCVRVADSSFSGGVNGYDHSNVSIVSCTLFHVYALWDSEITVENSTVTHDVYFNCYKVNCSINGLEPGFVHYWRLHENCTIEVSAGGEAPNLTVINTDVAGWSFRFEESSNATVSDSQYVDISIWDSKNINVNCCVLNGTIWIYDSVAHLRDTRVEGRVNTMHNSQLWLINSTFGQIGVIAVNAKIFVVWHLDVHVSDSEGTSVPGANATASYSNMTLAESKLTDAEGFARLELVEGFLTASEWYPVGNYTVQATFETYSNITTVKMIGNQMISLDLSDFIIPEFPSFLILTLFMIATLLAAIVYSKKTNKSQKLQQPHRS